MSDERRLFAETVREWTDKVCPKDRALELEAREYEFPVALYDEMTAAGFHAVGIPEEYGGDGGGPVETAILARGLARNLAGLTWVWAISSFAGGRAIFTAGSEEQKQRFLPELARGRVRFAIAVTEPGGGTDLLGALRTRAVRVDGGWAITGQKIWSTGAKDADYLLLLARTDGGTTLFLAPTEGLEMRFIPKLGMRAVGSCEVWFDEAFVPDELVLGRPDEGFKGIVGALNNERILSAAMALGGLEGVLEEALLYAGQRETFGRPIGAHQVIQHYIADLAIWRKQSELLVDDAARREEAGLPCRVEANIAKVATSEYVVEAADRGIQILGGMGLSLETQMQRYWRDFRQFRVAPISNEMARNAIGESLGLPRSF